MTHTFGGLGRSSKFRLGFRSRARRCLVGLPPRTRARAASEDIARRLCSMGAPRRRGVHPPSLAGDMNRAAQGPSSLRMRLRGAQSAPAAAPDHPTASSLPAPLTIATTIRCRTAGFPFHQQARRCTRSSLVRQDRRRRIGPQHSHSCAEVARATHVRLARSREARHASRRGRPPGTYRCRYERRSTATAPHGGASAWRARCRATWTCLPVSLPIPHPHRRAAIPGRQGVSSVGFLYSLRCNSTLCEPDQRASATSTEERIELSVRQHAVRHEAAPRPRSHVDPRVDLGQAHAAGGRGRGRCPRPERAARRA
jgi:hypothetical protein